MIFLDRLIIAFWLFAPAGLANMAPIFVKGIPFLDIPLDFGKTYRNRQIFGDHKTWRGLVAGILFGILGVFIQRLMYPYMQRYSIIDYSSANIFVLGFLLGFGALFGDCVKSFFKRQFRIKPGKPWFPFDQMDWIVGGTLFLLFYFIPPWDITVIALVTFTFLHPAINYTGYILKIKKSKW